jgi:hypothetical protein
VTDHDPGDEDRDTTGARYVQGPRVRALLSVRYTQADVARMLGVAKQAVSRHADPELRRIKRAEQYRRSVTPTNLCGKCGRLGHNRRTCEVTP